jgi:hypothetical protein
MPEKPSFAHDYTKENVELVRQTCLYVSTKLGDLLDDLVVVGGLVPSLLIPDESLPAGEDVHIGTMDLDLGLSLAILDREQYEDLTKGFTDLVLSQTRTRRAILHFKDGRFAPPLV